MDLKSKSFHFHIWSIIGFQIQIHIYAFKCNLTVLRTLLLWWLTISQLASTTTTYLNVRGTRRKQSCQLYQLTNCFNKAIERKIIPKNRKISNFPSIKNKPWITLYLEFYYQQNNLIIPLVLNTSTVSIITEVLITI